MDALDEYSDLVSAIYDAALDCDRWPVALEKMCNALEGSMAVLLRGDLAHSPGNWLTVRSDPEFDRRYDEYYRQQNVLWQRAGSKPVGSCVTDREVIPKEELVRSEFYNDFLLLQDVHTALRMYLLAEADRTAIVSVGRSPRRGEWEGKNVDQMRRLAPHLQRAAQINLRLGVVRLNEASASEALDALAHDAIIVSDDGKALFVNRAAAAIIAEADGIHIDGTGLRAAGRQDSEALRKLIAAAATAGTEPEAAGGALALSRPSGRRPLAILVAPLHAGAGWFGDQQPRAIVFLSDPEHLAAVPEKYLQRLYSITPAEAAVAVQIPAVRGCKPSPIISRSVWQRCAPICSGCSRRRRQVGKPSWCG
jgi:hypothetical protein